ncbi:MAG: DUF971 domain-containing protein [Candidatus Tectomicrobia bacterium]|uniref:DUF971 domain-containing protein n=1 Tax=Tectimicrobiota bacterium TaxID=2528274 RepID=A0A933E904_UNCTE|nr:DUF971 domain-containing protein [Candidatus Tectomicrobia bacterium]
MPAGEIPKPVDLTVDKRARELRIAWAGGSKSVFGFDYLSALCPCANCREKRLERERNPLAVLTGPTGPAVLDDASMVGRYAIQFAWRGGCRSGIYSFDYLYEIDPARARESLAAEEDEK